MTKGRWSISRRITIRITIATAVFVAAIAALSAWFLESSLNREFELLVHEEFEELEAFFESRALTSANFEAIATEVAEHHEEHGFAWRIWSQETTDVWEIGAVELFAERELSTRFDDETEIPQTGMRWRIQALQFPQHPHRGARVGLLLDGRRRLRSVRTSVLQATAVLAFFLVLVALSGVAFARHVSTMLHEVAERARGVRDPAEPVSMDVEGAPDEIREVASALGEVLETIRQASDRAHLMTAGLAHELRSPIQNLLGEAEVALMRDRSAQEYRGVLESQLEELRDLGRVVDNLVTLCATDQAPAGSLQEVFDLGLETELRLTKEHSAAARANVGLAISSSGDLSLHGDREAILLVIRNLVGNAIHWSPPGGTVTVRMEGGRDDVRVTVEDDGPGIPTSEREKVFEPFYRGSAQSGHRVGYGLGLALSRSAILAHDGEIDLSESESGGARFRVRLPRCERGATAR